MSMKRRLLGGATLLMAAFSLNEVKAQTCAVPPTCAQLGYTMKKADCGENPALRCPFALADDNQVYCGGETAEAELVVDAAIVYGDGMVSTKILSDKTPIGIVFDETDHLAIALTDVKKDGSAGSEYMNWSGIYNYDIPELENHSSAGLVIGFDGRANTDKILACGSSCGGTPAATACNLYQPTGCMKDFCKKTKWFLPSIWDLTMIYHQKSKINATLTSLASKGAQVLDQWFWYFSSTEYDSENVWAFNAHSGYETPLNKTGGGGPGIVRPVVKY